MEMEGRKEGEKEGDRRVKEEVGNKNTSTYSTLAGNLEWLSSNRQLEMNCWYHDLNKAVHISCLSVAFYGTLSLRWANIWRLNWWRKN